MIAGALDAPAVFAQQGDGGDVEGLGDIDRAGDVQRVAAGGEDDQAVAFAGEGLDPAREDVIEPVVVGGAGDVPEVRAGDGGEGFAISTEAPGEFLGEVGRVAG